MLFQNLSCAISSGDVLHLSGPNGSGKTSLLRIMAGALKLAAGEILWDERPFLENGAEEHAGRFAFLPSDDRHLKILETAGENLQFWAALQGDTAGCAPALERVGLESLAHTLVRRLSAGQRRRLSLARILLGGRPLWLLDEPFNGLDASSIALFRRALEEHVRGGGMAVIASHQPIEPLTSGALRRIQMGAAA